MYLISTPILFVIGGLFKSNNSVFKFNCIILPNFVRYLFADVLDVYAAGTSHSTFKFETRIEASRFCSIIGIVSEAASLTVFCGVVASTDSIGIASSVLGAACASGFDVSLLIISSLGGGDARNLVYPT